MKRRSINSVARQVRSRALKLQGAASEPTIEALVEFVQSVDLLGSYFEQATTETTSRLAVAANRELTELAGVRSMIESGNSDPQLRELNRSALRRSLKALIHAVDQAYPRR